MARFDLYLKHLSSAYSSYATRRRGSVIFKPVYDFVSPLKYQETQTMRTVGYRKERPVSANASGDLLAEGARFNDEMHRLPTGNTAFIPKGIYRFMTHAEANQHQLDCLIKGMARIAQERSHGRS